VASFILEFQDLSDTILHTTSTRNRKPKQSSAERMLR